MNKCAVCGRQIETNGCVTMAFSHSYEALCCKHCMHKIEHLHMYANDGDSRFESLYNDIVSNFQNSQRAAAEEELTAIYTYLKRSRSKYREACKQKVDVIQTSGSKESHYIREQDKITYTKDAKEKKKLKTKNKFRFAKSKQWLLLSCGVVLCMACVLTIIFLKPETNENNRPVSIETTVSPEILPSIAVEAVITTNESAGQPTATVTPEETVYPHVLDSLLDEQGTSSLNDLSLSNKYWRFSDKSTNFHIAGVEYNSGIGLFLETSAYEAVESGANGSGSVKYYLGEEYDTLSFDIGAESDDPTYYNANCGEARIQIIADGLMVYDSGYFGYSWTGYNQSVNLNSAKWVEINLLIRRGTGRTLNVVLGNARLSSDISSMQSSSSSAETPRDADAEKSIAGAFADDADLQTIKMDSESILSGAAACIITDCSTNGEQRFITIDYVSFYSYTDPESKVGLARCRNDSTQKSTFPVRRSAVFSMAVTDLSDESWYDHITYDMELNSYFKEVNWDTIAACYQTKTTWGEPSYFWVALDETGNVSCIWQEIDYYYAD